MNSNTCIYQFILISDEGYTEHSGCPVIEGEKWITTVWMREGVSDTDPSSSFDPRGVRVDVEQTGVMEPEEEENVQADVSYSQEEETGVVVSQEEELWGGVEAESEAPSIKGSSWFQKGIDKMKHASSKIFASKSEL
jgi:hypothetical protein